ncbi:MAG: hypothetical protein HY721_16330 [Planctomycetes bacterium]|nr:hypothetical protein [Planctomycetota bacterium]
MKIAHLDRVVVLEAESAADRRERLRLRDGKRAELLERECRRRECSFQPPRDEALEAGEARLRALRERLEEARGRQREARSALERLRGAGPAADAVVAGADPLVAVQAARRVERGARVRLEALAEDVQATEEALALEERRVEPLREAHRARVLAGALEAQRAAVARVLGALRTLVEADDDLVGLADVVHAVCGRHAALPQARLALAGRPFPGDLGTPGTFGHTYLERLRRAGLDVDGLLEP